MATIDRSGKQREDTRERNRGHIDHRAVGNAHSNYDDFCFNIFCGGFPPDSMPLSRLDE